jgi:hypothetical protein
LTIVTKQVDRHADAFIKRRERMLRWSASCASTALVARGGGEKALERHARVAG